MLVDEVSFWGGSRPLAAPLPPLVGSSFALRVHAFDEELVAHLVFVPPVSASSGLAPETWGRPLDGG